MDRFRQNRGDVQEAHGVKGHGDDNGLALDRLAGGGGDGDALAAVGNFGDGRVEAHLGFGGALDGLAQLRHAVGDAPRPGRLQLRGIVPKVTRRRKQKLRGPLLLIIMAKPAQRTLDEIRIMLRQPHRLDPLLHRLHVDITVIHRRHVPRQRKPLARVLKQLSHESKRLLEFARVDFTICELVVDFRLQGRLEARKVVALKLGPDGGLGPVHVAATEVELPAKGVGGVGAAADGCGPRGGGPSGRVWKGRGRQ